MAGSDFGPRPHSHPMKIITFLFVSLVIGVGIGWHFGYTRSNAQVAKEVGGVLEAQEDDAAFAAR